MQLSTGTPSCGAGGRCGGGDEKRVEEKSHFAADANVRVYGHELAEDDVDDVHANLRVLRLEHTSRLQLLAQQRLTHYA